jgi:hypothetical protein
VANTGGLTFDLFSVTRKGGGGGVSPIFVENTYGRVQQENKGFYAKHGFPSRTFQVNLQVIELPFHNLLYKVFISGPKELEIPENLYGLLHTRSWYRARDCAMHAFFCPLPLGFFYGKMARAHNNMLRLI